MLNLLFILYTIFILAYLYAVNVVKLDFGRKTPFPPNPNRTFVQRVIIYFFPLVMFLLYLRCLMITYSNDRKLKKQIKIENEARQKLTEEANQKLKK